MNTFVQEPWIPSWNRTVDETTFSEKEISAALFHLYGFNLWFAVEKSMQDIRDNIVKHLLAKVQKNKCLDSDRDCNTVDSLKLSITAKIEKVLDDDSLSARAEEFKEYKKSVEEWEKNCAETPENLGTIWAWG